jgi:hypothetical protein
MNRNFLLYNISIYPTLDVTPQIAANKQWRYIGAWLLLLLLYLLYYYRYHSIHKYIRSSLKTA